MASEDFVNELGYPGCEEMVHRAHICLPQQPHSCLSVQKYGMLSLINQVNEVCLSGAGSKLQGLC